MPLRAEGDAGSSDPETLPPAGDIRRLPAPWAGWFDRKRLRGSWIGFSQALAFFGMLRGLAIHYRVLESGQAAFGVSLGEALCWFGSQECHVNGDLGRDLGWTLWRAFLDAGGPWPTEFRLRAAPTGAVPSGRRETYQHQGPCCQQFWELMEPRDRIAWI
jgi:hypothetical protein